MSAITVHVMGWQLVAPWGIDIDETVTRSVVRSINVAQVIEADPVPPHDQKLCTHMGALLFLAR